MFFPCFSPHFFSSKPPQQLWGIFHDEVWVVGEIDEVTEAGCGITKIHHFSWENSLNFDWDIFNS